MRNTMRTGLAIYLTVAVVAAALLISPVAMGLSHFGQLALEAAPTPVIELTKTGPTTASVGDTITYDFDVYKPGPIDIMKVTVNDPKLGGDIWGPTDMDADTKQTFSKTYVVQPGDVPSITNTATATAISDYGPVKATASHTVNVTVPGPAITLTKTGPATASPGGTVTYTFTVKNTGGYTLHSVIVSDTLPAGDGRYFGAVDFYDLAVGETKSQTKSWTIPADWSGATYSNTGVVRGYDDNINSVGFTSTCVINIVPTPAPAIRLAKTTDHIEYAVGQTVTYNFWVKNTGNTTLDDVTVTDSRLGDLPVFHIGSMAAGEVKVFSVDYVVPNGTPLGAMQNTATVTGQYGGAPVPGFQPAGCEVEIVAPAIELEKSGPAEANVGDTMTYDFTVKNTGDVKLTGVTVSDPMLGGAIFGPVDMEHGTQQTFSKTYVVKDTDPNPLRNEATAIGTPRDGGPAVSDTASWEVIVPLPTPGTTSLSPTSKTAGDSAFTLTVNGTKFVAGSVVRWNGTDRTTTYV